LPSAQRLREVIQEPRATSRDFFWEEPLGTSPDASRAALPNKRSARWVTVQLVLETSLRLLRLSGSSASNGSTAPPDRVAYRSTPTLPNPTVSKPSEAEPQ
jgi:hypothetical protein